MKRLLKYLGYALLAAAVWAVYRQTAAFGFLRFDDPDYTFACPFVREGLTWSGVKTALTSVRYAAVWMPVTWLSYMADIAFFGPAPGVHHVVNALLHALNAVLLLHLCFRLAGRRSFAIGLLVAAWALHPQRVEAVAWIASRKELLWALFLLLSMLAASSKRMFLGLACMLLACMSKPTAMVTPFLAILILWMRRNGNSIRENCKIFQSKREGRAPSRPQKSAAHSERLSLFARSVLVSAMFLAIGTGILALYAQTHPEGMATKELFYAALPWRCLNACVAIGLDLFQAVIPLNLHLDYRAVPGAWPVNGLLGLVSFLTISLVAIIPLLRKGTDPETMGTDPAWRRIELFSILWFLISLSPTLGIFASFGEHARADRFLYVPMMALPLAGSFFIRSRLGTDPSRVGTDPSRVGTDPSRVGTDPSRVGTGPTNRVGTDPTNRVGTDPAWCVKMKQVLFVLVTGYLGLLIFLTYRLTETYRDDVTAFSHTLACDPNHGRALAHIGEAACAAGDLDRGIDALRRSRTLRPAAATDGKLAYALMRRARSADFEEIRAICAPYAKDPALDAKGQALEALGTAELKSRDWSHAAVHLAQSITAPARFYSSADAKLKLAFAFHNGGRRKDARTMFTAIAQSTRTDLAERAQSVLNTLATHPDALLFW